MQPRAQIQLQQLSYHLPNNHVLFNELTLSIAQRKTGLVGRNGIGKSTLLKLIIGELPALSGSIHCIGSMAYVPQNPVITPNLTIAGILGLQEKLAAFYRITAGSIDERDFAILNEEWHIEERLQQQLNLFGLTKFRYDHPIKLLSGGEVTRLLLTKAFFSQADMLLLDEPTNHLDHQARKQLYAAITQWQGGLIVISHDRTLLNLMEQTIELNSLGTSCYGGNYAAYQAQKSLQKAARESQLLDAKKLLQKNQRSIQAGQEKHAQKQSYGRARRDSTSKLAADAAANRSERGQANMLIKSQRLLNQASTALQLAKDQLEIVDTITVAFPATHVPNGKLLLELEDLTFGYPNSPQPIIEKFSLSLQGPARIAIAGPNGSGKTTLIKLLLGELQATQGKIYLGTTRISYLDQNANLLKPELSILENFSHLNPDINNTDARLYLAQFLFKKTEALKLVKDLSGGEKLRAQLACTLLSKQAPQLLILDEPTNHLDLDSIAHLESALKNYQGALLVISHDQQFLEAIGINKSIHAPFRS